jgi:hypothetical protein
MLWSYLLYFQIYLNLVSKLNQRNKDSDDYVQSKLVPEPVPKAKWIQRPSPVDQLNKNSDD